ncbi:MAG: GTP cyclohydrolase I FolE2 [Actinobacteria bacterium]|nr:MAG: GTP cyclohydrolase I FolE2 [Actinomycetota bacterium]
MTAVSRLLTGSPTDVQARRPAVHVSLSRVGVTGVRKVVRIRANGSEQLFYAELDCFVDLGPKQKGAHMSRFEEVINEAIGQVVLSESPFRAETLAQHIAELVRARQGAERAEVTIAARYPEHKPAPVSGVQTQEIYTLHGRAVACDRARARLSEDGFDGAEVERILRLVPVATHNQRGIGTLHVGCVEGCNAEIEAATLLRIVESSMSSEIYELMKRSDEAEVVEKAHRRPRFVEDCVREMIRMAVEEFESLDNDVFLCARQRNLETIHQHDVVAERHGMLGDLAREVAGEAGPARHVTVREWLDGA